MKYACYTTVLPPVYLAWNNEYGEGGIIDPLLIRETITGVASEQGSNKIDRKVSVFLIKLTDRVYKRRRKRDHHSLYG